jgi:hypothetical protein
MEIYKVINKLKFLKSALKNNIMSQKILFSSIKIKDLYWNNFF